MKISYYMPFKPMGHKNPSGDLVTGSELFSFFKENGHHISIASELRSRWIYYKPWTWYPLFKTVNGLTRRLKDNPPDIWLTYHSYYKSPDLLGPIIKKRLKIPYVLFQGIYSTKRRKRIKTRAGYYLNKKALETADLVITNKKRDQKNLLRLLPPEKVLYIAPGLHPKDFTFDLVSRRSLRNRWQTGSKRIVLTTAMFRPGVKTQGLLQVIDSCFTLQQRGIELHLVIAGDGTNRNMIKEYAMDKLGDQFTFLGKIPRHELYRYYSAADVFAFPGINESLGMVFLEAQASGLPAVAFGDWGASEAIIHEKTGLLSPANEKELFTNNIERLLTNDTARKNMRDEAKIHVRKNHDLIKNYEVMAAKLEQLITEGEKLNVKRETKE